MKKAILISASYLLPVFAMAASFDALILLAQDFQEFLGVVMPIVFAIAVIYFFWGVAKYILAAGDPGKAAEGKSIMIYGVIAIAVMAALYGLVEFLAGSFGITTGGTIDVPDLPA